MSTFAKARVYLRRRFRPDSPADHAEAQLLLQRYLDGRVDAQLAAKVAAHIAHCPTCTFDTKTFTALKESLRRHGAPPDAVLGRLEAFALALAAGDLDETVLTEPRDPPNGA